MTILTTVSRPSPYPSGTTLWIPLLAIIFRLASSNTASVSYFILALYALRGRVQAIQALALSWLFSMISSGIAPAAPMASIGRYAVFLTAAVSVLVFTRNRPNIVTLATVLLGLFYVVHSLFFSSIVDVSVLKAASWSVVVVTLIEAWAGLTSDVRSRLVEQVFGLLTILMILSIPMIFLPVGYLRNGTGFQGVFSHPQVLGPTMALLGTWAAGQMLAQRQPSWSLFALVGSCLIIVLLSEARTAGIALVLGIGIGVVMVTSRLVRDKGVALPGIRSTRFQLIVVLALLGLVFTSSSVNSLITNYLTKSDRAQISGIRDAYQDSRGGLIERMWANIEEDPWIGIGFGIASDPREMEIERDPLLGLPVSASIEKGVLPLAVLEEVGIYGFVLTALWISILFSRATRGGIVPTAVSLTALLLNLGESTLFSPSGFGLLPLILLGWAFASKPRSQYGYER